jgi:hypothetical protein
MATLYFKTSEYVDTNYVESNYVSEGIRSSTSVYANITLLSSVIPGDERTYKIMQETRSFEVSSQIRTYNIEQETRHYNIG